MTRSNDKKTLPGRKASSKAPSRTQARPPSRTQAAHSSAPTSRASSPWKKQANTPSPEPFQRDVADNRAHKAAPDRRRSSRATGGEQGQEQSREPRRRPASATGSRPKTVFPPRSAPAINFTLPDGAPPVAVLSRRAADKLRAGHAWVYRSDVEAVLPSEEAAKDAALIVAVDSRGIPLGSALWSPSSEIALRKVTDQPLQEEEWLPIVEQRLRRAIARRTPMLSSAQAGHTDSYRVCFSEADELPGLIIDRYGDLVLVQLQVRGLDSEAIRNLITRTLVEEMEPQTIVERYDARMRLLEGMEPKSKDESDVLYSNGQPQLEVVFSLNGLRFHYDARSGQKTGAFLDQRENYAAAARYGHGRALDICTYQGGFALHLARTCSSVTGVDQSRASLEVAERNLVLNREAGALKTEVEWVEADAFALLRDWSSNGERFDTIVLDPPAFAKSKRATEGALRGYKEMNLRAMKMLQPGGVLVTCSCSHHVSAAEFEGVIRSAASDAGVRLRLVERRGAAQDHPAVLTLPESEYLKCLICIAD